MLRKVLFASLFLLAAPAHADDWSFLEDEVDAFAAAFLNDLQARSFSDEREYCGLIGWDADGNLAATEPVEGLADSCDPGIEPDGFEVLASYHTHGAYHPDADTEVPSLGDLEADIDEGIDGYISTPGGRLWLNLAEDGTAYLLCDLGCLDMDPEFRECEAYLPEDTYTLDGLQRREDEDPGYC